MGLRIFLYYYSALRTNKQKEEDTQNKTYELDR